MSDLISREQAILKCRQRLYESALINIGVECKADVVFSDIAQNRIKDWLEELPSTREERGEWIEDGYQVYPCVCSVCGTAQDIKAKFMFSFCPNCGADMRGEEE